MRLHVLQHVPFEDSPAIADWANKHGHFYGRTQLCKQQPLPEVDQFDWLLILGGPMSVYDEQPYPWLKAEKQLIAAAIQKNKTVTGFCLGAQLIASVLGAKVLANPKKEIGWFPVSLTAPGQVHPFFRGFPSPFLPFHWHGETFELPKGAEHLAASAGCAHQAFAYGDRVLGLQFHLEFSTQTIQRLAHNCAAELGVQGEAGEYIQTAEALVDAHKSRITGQLLETLLDNLSAR